jgi:large subunit ribosomal protein L20
VARVKRAVNAKKHHKAILEEAKGYYGDRSRTFRSANQAVQHSGVYAFRDRRARKGEMRKLWIQRINAGTRAHGIEVDRRMLADLAVNDAGTFGVIVAQANDALAK